MLYCWRRILLEFLHQDIDCFLELEVVAFAPSFWIKLHFDVGLHAVIFHLPGAFGVEEGDAGRGHEAAVHELRIIVNSQLNASEGAGTHLSPTSAPLALVRTKSLMPWGNPARLCRA